MKTADKIAIGCTAVIGASALTMLIMSNRYLMMAENVNAELRDIHTLMSKCREDIIEGNNAAAESNEILRKIARESLREVVESPSYKRQKEV